MKKAGLFKPKISLDGASKFNGRKHIDDMYDKVWEKYRLSFLKVNPKCYSCGNSSTVVDHVTPHKGDEYLFKKTDNHIPLCTSCHNYISSKFDTRFIRGQSIEPKLTWIAANRSRNNITTKVYVVAYPYQKS
jgi:5-methylcytosine-specific restriction endonuclease McrA